MLSGGMKKKQRVGNTTYSDLAGTLSEIPSATAPSSPPCLPPPPSSPSISTIPGGFNDPATADVILRLRLHLDPDTSSSGPVAASDFLDLHLHSSALFRSRYFAALLSDRWHQQHKHQKNHVDLRISSSAGHRHRPFDAHVAVLRLLHTLDFRSTIATVTDAVAILHVALELLFDECIRFCVRFLEAVPWTEDEEEKIVFDVVPLLRPEESRHLLARVSTAAAKNSSEEMLHTLILHAIHSHPTVATVKAFVATLLRDFSPRDSVRKVLDRAFMASLETVKELLASYASPDFRAAGDYDETDAFERLNLHAAVMNARKVVWLVERMIELRVVETAVREWSEQAVLAADLQKAFRDESWRNIAPGLPALVMKCTARLAGSVAAGNVLAAREVRMKLVKDWLPVLNVCRNITCANTVWSEATLSGPGRDISKYHLHIAYV